MCAHVISMTTDLCLLISFCLQQILFRVFFAAMMDMLVSVALVNGANSSAKPVKLAVFLLFLQRQLARGRL